MTTNHTSNYTSFLNYVLLIYFVAYWTKVTEEIDIYDFLSREDLATRVYG